MNFKIPKWHRLHNQSDKTVLNSSADKSGLPSGSLVHIGKKHKTEGKISVVQYNVNKLLQHNIGSIAELKQLQDGELMTWVNIDGLHDINIVESIGRELNIHSLVLEDILSTHQRPKLEEYGDYIYIVAKSISVDYENNLNLHYEQISMLLLENIVVTFQEKTDDIFSPIYNQLQNHKGRLRKLGSDYLAYVILDTIVDEYFVIENNLDEIIDPLEDNLLSNPTTEMLQAIQQIRRQLINMKRSISPLRELLTKIQHTDSALLQEKTLPYYGDVHDHVIRVTESLESYRERIAAMQDIYLSGISNKINETMKVLTIFASIFIPLTFIAGIYGMNFEYMPELKWRWAYPALWVLCITISVSLLIYFKKKKWL